MHALILLALVVLQALPEPKPAQEPPIPQDHAAIHREMDELFQKIELRQQAIDRRLYDASAGKKLAQPVEVSGIGALLQLAHDDGRSDQRDMQRILELAASHTHQGGT